MHCMLSKPLIPASKSLKTCKMQFALDVFGGIVVVVVASTHVTSVAAAEAILKEGSMNHL